MNQPMDLQEALPLPVLPAVRAGAQNVLSLQDIKLQAELDNAWKLTRVISHDHHALKKRGERSDRNAPVRFCLSVMEVWACSSFQVV